MITCEHNSGPASLASCAILRKGNIVTACTISETARADATAIAGWYQDRSLMQPTYADDPTWKSWWIEAIQGADPELRVHKLSAPGGEILGLVALKRITDWYDGEDTLYIQGLRINPRDSHARQAERQYKKIGTALIDFAIAESVRQGCSGISVKSSIGTELFYRKLGLHEQKTFDGKQSYFTLKGDALLHKLLEGR